MTHINFSGIWRSHYKYPSSSRKGEFEGKHIVRVYQTDHKLVFESLPEVNKSYLIIRLRIDEKDNVATGSWEETTDPKGYYKGAVYHGAIQLIIDDAEHMRGKWLGFGKDREVNVGPWELTYLGKNLPEVA